MSFWKLENILNPCDSGPRQTVQAFHGEKKKQSIFLKNTIRPS